MKQEVTPIDGFHYSTNEQFTGKYWIDGKKIYQKTVDFGALPNATSKSVNHNIGNLNKILNVVCVACRSRDNDTFMVGNIGDVISVNSSIVYIKEPTSVQSMSEYNAFATIQYTKTTD